MWFLLVIWQCLMCWCPWQVFSFVRALPSLPSIKDYLIHLQLSRDFQHFFSPLMSFWTHKLGVPVLISPAEHTFPLTDSQVQPKAQLSMPSFCKNQTNISSHTWFFCTCSNYQTCTQEMGDQSLSLQHEEFKPIAPICPADCPNNQNMLVYAEKDARFIKSERKHRKILHSTVQGWSQFARMRILNFSFSCRNRSWFCIKETVCKAHWMSCQCAVSLPWKTLDPLRRSWKSNLCECCCNTICPQVEGDFYN